MHPSCFSCPNLRNFRKDTRVLFFQLALDFATHLGMKSVSFEVIEMAKAEERMKKVLIDQPGKRL